MVSLNLSKYEDFAFYFCRSLWCIWITTASFSNLFRMNKLIKYVQSDQEIALYYYYDENVELNLKILSLFFVFDLIFRVIKKKFNNKSIIFHHIISIALCLVTLTSKYPHHYYANLFMCTEVVSCLSILQYFAKKYKSNLLYKCYQIQYLFLTVFVRGGIWLTVLIDLNNSEYNTRYICYFGIMPLAIMDVIWSKQCIVSLMK